MKIFKKIVFIIVGAVLSAGILLGITYLTPDPSDNISAPGSERTQGVVVPKDPPETIEVLSYM